MFASKRLPFEVEVEVEAAEAGEAGDAAVVEAKGEDLTAATLLMNVSTQRCPFHASEKSTDVIGTKG